MPWKSKNAQVENVVCSLCPEPKDMVPEISRVVQHKYHMMMEAYPNQEWFAYLQGTIEDKVMNVIDMFVPPHAHASGGMAEAEPFSQPDGCIGTIHSHHHMGAFHSGTDQAHVDSNFPLNITIAFNRGQGKDLYEFDTVINTYTPCHKRITGRGILRMVMPSPLFDYKEFIAEAKENVDRANPAAQKPIERGQLRLTDGKEPILAECASCPNDHLCSDELKGYWKSREIPCEFRSTNMEELGQLNTHLGSFRLSTLEPEKPRRKHRKKEESKA